MHLGNILIQNACILQLKYYPTLVAEVVKNQAIVCSSSFKYDP